MVVQKTINTLKDKPHEEKTAVASGIAIFIVIILLVGWGFLFLRKIQSGSAIPQLRGDLLPEDQFDYTLIQEAEEYLFQSSGKDQSQFETLRESAIRNSIDSSGSVSPQQSNEATENPFGVQNTP